MSNVLTLQQRYRALIGEAEEIRKNYTNTDTEMSDDEVKSYDEIMDQADKVWAEIEREKALDERIKRMNEVEKSITVPQPTKKEVEDVDAEKGVKTQMKAFNSFLRGGFRDDEFQSLQSELKVLQMDLDEMGGFLVAPQIFVEQLLQNVDDMVAIRGMATKFPVLSADSLGVPSLDTDLNDADWTVELSTGSQDDAIRFGKRELHPHPFAKRVKISNTLLRKAAIDPEALVRERIAYKFATTEEKGFLTGSGANQPLGVFTASAQGISTNRDVTSGSSTAITADSLIDTLHFLKGQYWANATWIFHRDAVRNIRKLKDGNGQYLWQPGIRDGVPGMILDRPYVMSEFAPNTFTTGQYVGIIGDFRAYWIADSLALQIQRVTELYAENNQTGYIARAEADGMPVLEEAFARLKLA